MAPRKPGCIPCRERHVRCDAARPICSTCQHAKDGRQCSYVSLRIRQSKYGAQMEKRPLAINPLASPAIEKRSSQSPAWSSAQPPTVSPVHASFLEYEESRYDQIETQQSTISSENRHEQLDLVQRPSSSSYASDRTRWLVRTSTPEYRSRQWPISNATDIMVFQYYIRHAAHLLDIVSPELHMSHTVPRLAQDDILLRAACLAYAGHRLHLLGKLERDIEEGYSEMALQLLIPKLSEDLRTWPGSVLAVTILLRMSEQFSEIGDDQQYHLNGAFSICAAAGRKWNANGSDIESDCFWTYLRMTVRVCFLQQAAPNCDLSIIDESVHLSSDTAWTNTMLCILAKMCSVCWSDSSAPHKTLRLSELAAEVADWRRTLPRTFDPWASIEKAGSVFPTYKYLRTWHVVGWQFYYAAEVLLAIYYRSTARTSSILSQGQWLEREVLVPTRKLCAITMSCENMGTETNGSHLMAWCGQYLTNGQEQMALIDWLDQFMHNTKWPNLTCSERLRRIWNGHQSDWIGVEHTLISS